MKTSRLAFITLLVATPALAQQMPDAILTTAPPQGEGWRGFSDFSFLLGSAFTRVLAAVLGAAIAYHPRHKQTADTLEEIEAAQIYILYAVIGSVTGILVAKYGMGMGFVLFGIGALIRFRTVLRSASLTGRLIFVTLIGLSCGLDLPHVAVLFTAFGFALIYILDARFTYRIEVRGLAPELVAAAALAYRQVLEGENFRIISEKKYPEKGRIRFIFRSPKSDMNVHLEAMFDEKIESGLRGFVDWEID